MGCYIQQCFLDANGTLTTFNGEGGTITVPGTYEIIKSCNQSETSDWFRVMAKLELYTPGINTIVSVVVFFNEVMITLNSAHDVWVSVCHINHYTASAGSLLLKCPICVHR